jgi:hypothetical protein
MNRKTPTFTEYKMDLEENEVHGHPLPSFSIKLETEITAESTTGVTSPEKNKVQETSKNYRTCLRPVVGDMFPIMN